MEYLDMYQAACIQPIIRSAETRDVIMENVKRVCELIDEAPQYSIAGAKNTYKNWWAPMKLVSFPEFFIQGHEGNWTHEHYIKNVLIEMDGPEMEPIRNKAIEHEIYIAGCCLEHDPQWKNEDYIFNTHFLIDPKGDIVMKYRKLTVATHFELSMSPHDIYDEYVAMYGDDLSTFFPVADLEIGKIGLTTCMDAHFPENYRALGQQGAEVILHPVLVDPLLSEPTDVWTAINRVRAWENICYIVCSSWGAYVGSLRPENTTPGQAMIANYNGMVLAKSHHPGESIISATINLEELRRRRLDPSRNYPTMLRNEIYRKIYTNNVYEANQFTGMNPRTRESRDSIAAIKDFVDRGIYTRPEKVPDFFKAYEEKNKD
ncbi:MAG: hypothetical protein IJI74_03770 [Firmicutes bacterium]|nr:hypothetical protein [Bacillota bacterium]